MTQLDIPTISFSHYLDLLKRRTWHVVLVSILGLVVGGAVALLIPRYYVASTVIQLNSPVLDPKVGNPEDPMSVAINAAYVTVRGGVSKAIDELGWPEAQGTAENRRMYVTNVQERVQVVDLGPANKGRRIAQLQISYRDINGERAADLANKLRDLWESDFLGGQDEKARDEIKGVADRLNAVRDLKQEASLAIQQFEEENNINPQDWVTMDARGLASLLTQQLQRLQTQILELEGNLLQTQGQLTARRAELDTTPPTEALTLPNRLNGPQREEYLAHLGDEVRIRASLSGLRPGHPAFAGLTRRLETVQERLVELREIAEETPAERLNPRFGVLKREIADLEVSRDVTTGQLRELNNTLAALQVRSNSLPAIYNEYRSLREVLEERSAEADAFRAQMRQMETDRARLSSEAPMILRRASVPARPTDPNPYLVALIGCAIGLAVAIGLVLVIDMLQMTFKSVTDVESGLGLPVLGTMSFMVTDEEISAARLRRIWMGVFAVAFLVLLLTVVTFYYVDASRLPPWLVSFLDQILKESR